MASEAEPPPPLVALEKTYDEICRNFPTSVGKVVSAKERDGLKKSQSTLVYGEITFTPFATALMKIRELYGGLRGPGGKFYDIGSGTGKPVIAAALLHSWDSCTGIEILEGLHATSLELLAVWSSPEATALRPPSATARIDFIRADATTYPWQDADVWFANSTCFDDALMAQLAKTAEGCKVGSFAITFTKKIPSAQWQVLESELEVMSWGHATVHIHRKIS
jgi:SAM-dependent methyltransferase